MKDKLLSYVGLPVLVCALFGGLYLFSQVIVDPELDARNDALAAELARISARNDRLRLDNARLKASIARLREGDAESLHHARTELGLIKSGEVIYRFDP